MGPSIGLFCWPERPAKSYARARLFLWNACAFWRDSQMHTLCKGPWIPYATSAEIMSVEKQTVLKVQILNFPHFFKMKLIKFLLCWVILSFFVWDLSFFGFDKNISISLSTSELQSVFSFNHFMFMFILSYILSLLF